MTLTIKHQEHNSRIELLVRTLFGWLYILLPHAFILFFVGIWSAIVTVISFLMILFTGRYPQTLFEFKIGFMQWHLRVTASMFNLTDGYPAFGISSADDSVKIEMQNPENLSRLMLIVKLLFGVLYVALPHYFILFFRWIATFFMSFIGFWIILFAGRIPTFVHEFITGTLRWGTRVSLYLSFMTDEYPPFSSK